MSEKGEKNAKRIIYGGLGILGLNVLYKKIFSNTRTKIYLATAITGIFIATQCNDEIKTIYNDFKETEKTQTQQDTSELEYKTNNIAKTTNNTYQTAKNRETQFFQQTRKNSLDNTIYSSMKNFRGK
ncbi:hypothetical protein K9L97_05345 [Candidatus Woesearchaeota archaeon]|nr:hypothetical protein [Candidatus Woesearchaeota archaeon]